MSIIKAINLDVITINGNPPSTTSAPPSTSIDNIAYAFQHSDGTTSLFYDGLGVNTLSVLLVNNTVTSILSEINATGDTQNGIVPVTFIEVNGTPVTKTGLINFAYITNPTAVDDASGNFLYTWLQVNGETRRYVQNLTMKIAEDWRAITPPYGNQ
jgi:hypothetical protein